MMRVTKRGGGVNARGTDTGSAVVTIVDDIIVCRLNGHITGRVVQGSMHKTKVCADQLHIVGKKARLLLDIGNVTGQTSEARREAKRLTTFGLDRIAVSGGSRAIVVVGKYIARAGGMGDYTRFFRSEKMATAWLKGSDRLQPTQQGRGIRGLIAFIVVLISVSVLIGWATDNQTLKTWLPDASSMNPTSAVNFILMSFAVLLLRKGALSTWRKAVVMGVAIWFMVYGGIIVLRNTFGVDVPIDRLLFNDKLVFSSSIAPTTSLGYLLLGGIVLVVLSGMRKLWQRYVFHGFSVMLVVITLGAILGIGFGMEQLYGGNFIPMALNTAVVFLLLNHVMQTVASPLPLFARIMSGLDKYWRPVLVLTAMIFIVGLAWQQAKREGVRTHDAAVREEFIRVQDAITDRFTTYTNVLRGYKGFFESSQSVSYDEYVSYFASAQPAGGYPGFTAISFIRYIPKSQEGAYVAEMRSQATAVPMFGSFDINPKTNNQTLYPLTYIQPASSTSGWGFDLGTSKPRRVALEAARDSGRPTASGAIDLNASRTDTTVKRTGFFMTIPIYKPTNGRASDKLTTAEARRNQIYGFINTVFENEVIFNDIFNGQTSKEVQFVVTDARDGNSLYTYNPKAKNLDPVPVYESRIVVGGQQWRIAMYAPVSFGSDGLAQLLPYLILFGGGLLSMAVFAFLLGQMRQRDQALRLADDMTEDLRHERNDAVVAQQKDEAILASIGDAVFAIDKKGKILLFNPAAETISGYTSAEVVGSHYSDILHFIFDKDRTANQAFIKSAMEGHLSKMHNHTKLIRKDGSEVFVADSAAPIRDRSGEVVGVIVVFRDVSKELALEQAKSEFVSLASHQLRTPLSAINWYAEMLLSGDAGKINKDQQEYMREIYDGNQRMIELVDSLLNVSRLEVGKLKNDPQHTSMLELAASLEKEMRTTITGKKMILNKELSANLPTIYADPKLLRMIVQNLLSNAVKYTPAEGTVTLVMREATPAEVIAAKLREGQSYFFMSVSDTGYGIPKEQQRKIFEKLFRADNVRKLDVEGTGLGLYIIKEVSKKLGGAIWFESKESVGTTFYVVLPFKTDPS